MIIPLAGGAVATLESAAIALLLGGTVSWLAATLLHVAIVSAIVAWTYGSPDFRTDKTWPLLLGTCTAVMGPIGAAGVVLAKGLTAYYRRSATPFADWYTALFPEAQTDPCAELLARIRAGAGDSTTGVAPFRDILALGTLNQKRELIMLIAKHFRPAFAPALRMALNDANNAIRVQAASAVARIEDEFMARGVELRRAVSSEGSTGELLALARHYDAYAETGLLDADRAQTSRDSALDAYRRYLEIEPRDVGVRAAVGRLLLRSKRLDDAIDWLADARKDGAASPGLLIAYMEALFQLGRFTELREVARQSRADTHGFNSRDEAAEAVRLWAGDHVRL